MAFRFVKSNAVAVGTFNIYIIQPSWLAEIGVMEKGAKVKIATDFSRPGFRYIADDDPIHWQIFPERIIIESKDSATDCGEILGQILDKLPWTPLVAIGVNAEFHGEKDELDRIGEGCAPPKTSGHSGYDLKQRTAHLGLMRGDHVFNAQISEVADHAELSLNVHSELKEKARQDANRIAQEACRGFLPHRTEAVELAQKSFSIEVSYDYWNRD